MTQQKYSSNSYLSFKLGEETFASNVEKVLNILELTKITKVPKAPEYMKGVINLRGSVLPLIDTRVKFDMGETEFTNNTCILVLEVNLDNESVSIGALVDSVQEVIELNDGDISEPPSIGSKYRSDFIEGMAQINDEFIMLLDMDLIFTLDELSVLKEISKIKQDNPEKEKNTQESKPASKAKATKKTV